MFHGLLYISSDGYIYIHSLVPGDSCKYHKGHDSDVLSVDIKGSIYATGSKDKFIKVWPLLEDESELNNHIYAEEVNDRVWKTALSSYSDDLFVGTAGVFVPAIRIIDLNR